jgi:hypothetical protein
MSPGRFSSPFAPLSLSLEEKEQLCHVADTIIGETMARYEQFLGQEKGHIDPATWEKLREHEQTRIYYNLRPGGGTDNHNMHLFLMVGTVVGTLYDAVYGAMSSTTDAMRIKSAYKEDSVIDMCVLDSIVQPTPDAPFESMVVRWSLNAVPIYVRLLVNHQDAVFIEMTSVRQLSNGEHVGVHLSHSVAFDKTPPFKEYGRINTSNCMLWRQTSPDRVELYVVSYLEIKDSIMVRSIVKSVAAALISSAKIMECARLKKLSWLVLNKDAVTKCKANSGHAPDEGCSICGSQHRSTRRGIKSACAVCSQYTCKKCSIKQALHMFAPDGQLLKHEMRFCVPCIRSATDLDAAAVATDEAATGIRTMEYESGEYSDVSFTMSSSSSSHSGEDSLFRVHRTESAYSARGKTTLALASANGTRAPERPMSS